MWEAVYLGTKEWDKLLLGKGGHGDNRGGAGLGEREREKERGAYYYSILIES
jgi:hypothetical protein